MSDFAPWLTKCFKETFPNAIQGKCYFHMKQNVKKKFPKFFAGLEEHINIISLALDEIELHNIWTLIKKTVSKDHFLKPISSKFIEYFEENYLSQANKSFYIGALPPGYGNTNNALEGHHRYLKSQIFENTVKSIGNSYCLFFLKKKINF